MANKLNTTQIGDNFEATSLSIIKELIIKKQFGIEEQLKINSKAKYYSRDRQSDIEFDLTIEVWPPNARRYSLIYFIECKNYKNRVPVSKVEEFYSKIKQVSGVNAKGVFITNSPLQKGGLNFANNKGMMVIIAESNENYDIILHKSNNLKQYCIPFINEYENIDFDTLNISKIIDKKILKIFQNIAHEEYVSYGINYLSKEDIISITNYHLNEIDKNILSNAMPLNKQKLIEYIKEGLNIKINHIQCNSRLLGSCDVHNKIISINQKISNKSRELFILAHELGHFILHQRLSIGQNLYDLFHDSQYNFHLNKHDFKNPRHWIEWQANCFASSLILPRQNLILKLREIQEKLKISKGKIHLNDEYYSQNEFMKILTFLSNYFNVTFTSVRYKLNEMNFIDDQTKLKQIGQIIFENKKQFISFL